jgi:cytochrome c551/c552
MSRWNKAKVVVFALAAGACVQAAAQTAKPLYPGVGRAATSAEIAAWDIDVRGDLKGLPPGSGSVSRGETLWEAKCTSCHGSFGESNQMFPPLIGGITPEDIKTGRVAALAKGGEQRTTVMKLSRISTLWDYINRAMPWNAPKTLTADEVYALTAYLLNQGNIVPDSFVLSDKNMAEVQARLPNRNGLTRNHGLWETRGKPDVNARACMKNCGPEPRITSSLPDHARGSHGDLVEQNRPFGPVRAVSLTGGTAIAAAVPAAAAPAADPAQTLAAKAGCMACHTAKQRVIGPSFAEIATKYRADSGAETRLMAKVKSGGQGVWGNVPMPPFADLQEQDLRTLVRWILKTE